MKVRRTQLQAMAIKGRWVDHYETKDCIGVYALGGFIVWGWGYEA